MPHSFHRMNRSLSALIITLASLTVPALHADPVPQVISYQGRLADSSGNPLAATTPMNRKMVFSLYDAPTGGNKVWTEQQFVTISGGEFSVLLGNGTAFGALAHEPLDKVFSAGGTSFYLELQVDDGDTVIDAADAVISPRQQIVTSGFAFRAHSAESITAGADLRFLPGENAGVGNYGLGFYDSSRTFGGVVVGGPVLYGQGGGALGSTNGSTRILALTWLSNGNVGVGVVAPSERLHVAGNIKATGNMTVGGAVLAAGAVSATGAVTAASVSSTGAVTGTTITGTSLSITPVGASSEVAGITADGAINITKGGTMNGPTGNLLNITSEGKIKIRELVVTGTATATNGGSTAEVLSAHKRLVLGGATGWGDTVASTPGAPAEGANAATGMRLILLGNNASTNLVGFGLTSSTKLFSITPPAGKTSWFGGTTEQLALNGTTGLLSTRNLIIGSTTEVADGQLAMEGSSFARLTLSQTAVSMDETKSLVISNRSDGRADLGWLKADGTSVVPVLTFKRTTTDSQISDQVGDYGYVGINTQNPKAPLHVVQSDGYIDDATTNTLPDKPVTVPPTSDADHRREYGVYVGIDGGMMTTAGYYTAADGITHRYEHIGAIFEGDIVTRRSWFGSGLDTSSDVRAKHIFGLSDNDKDLATLMKLKVTDYQWIDRSIDGRRPHKRLIAQQVNEVFPQATRIAPYPQVIPNVYELATELKHDAASRTLTITTKKPHDFKVGDIVDLIGDKRDMKETAVKAVLDAHQFVVDIEGAVPKKLFVYGKQVKDFRSVDYDAISMLNLSATQALKKQNDALAQTNKELRDQLTNQARSRAALEKARASTDAKFAALEALLRRKAKPAAATASLRK